MMRRTSLLILLVVLVAMTGCMHQGPRSSAETNQNQTVTVALGIDQTDERIQEFQEYQRNISSQQEAGNITQQEAAQLIRQRGSELESDLINESQEQFEGYVEDSESLEILQSQGIYYQVSGDRGEVLELLEKDGVDALLPEDAYAAQTQQTLPGGQPPG